MTHVSKVALVATLSRAVVAVLWILIAALSNIATWAPTLPYVQSIQLRPYDSSSSLLAPFPLSLVLSWDAVYFLRIAETGYPFEQFNAFFPLYPFLAQQLSPTITAIVPSMSNTAAIVAAALLLSNVAFVLAACMLFKLTQAVLKNDNLAFTSAVLFCCSPSAIFMSSLYTESSFALLAFTGMYLHAKKCDWLASLVWMAGTTVRSNGIAFVGFFFYSLLKTCMHAKSFRVIGRKAIAVVIQTLVVLSGFAAFQYYGYLLYCKSEDSLKRPWCDANMPLLYSFVQKEYWNNGFLRYWTLSQLPNFLLASPMLFTSLSAVAAYWASSPSRFICLNLIATPARTNGLTGFLSNDAFPHVILCLALTVYCATCMHVQIITRFFTSMPCVYWYLAHLCLRRGDAGKSARKWVLGWFVGYGCVGVVLFSLFFPPA